MSSVAGFESFFGRLCRFQRDERDSWVVENANNAIIGKG